jgi:uncharacterized protein YjdB
MKTKTFKTMALCAMLATVAVFSACEKEKIEEGNKPVAVTGVTLSQATAELTVGDTLRLTAAVKPDDADNKAVA